MARSGERNTISGVIDYDPVLKRTVASLQYADVLTSDTYTIDRGEGISVRFDGHIPVHPDLVVWEVSDRVGEQALLSSLLGQELAEAMLTTKTSGMAVISFCLTTAERRALAHLQLKSPSTPPLLKLSVAGMLGKSSIQTD